MVLADLGADVVRIQRPGAPRPTGLTIEADATYRGRRIVDVDLKDARRVADVLDLIDSADVLVEGFRPGVTERLGLGPEVCLERNPRLVYARLTGWGQEGPWAHRAGHDLNYLAVSGVLDNIGEPGRAPVPPLSLLADFGGGSMPAVIGITSALIERYRSGRGQVIDAAMLDGTAQLAQLQWTHWAAGSWRPGRGANILDGSAPFYTTYLCKDGGYMAVAPLEPHFYERMLHVLRLDRAGLPDQWDREGWPRLRAAFAEVFCTRTQAEWSSLFFDEDACVTPVLDYQEARTHPQMQARGTLDDSTGRLQARPAPRFSRSETWTPPPAARESLCDILESWRVDPA